MIKNEKDNVYLITHSYGEVIDGITYDEESAKYFVDKMNEKYKKSMKCVEIHFKSNGHGSRSTVFCVNDVNDKLNKNYIESPNEYHYQKIDVLDVNKMLGE